MHTFFGTDLGWYLVIGLSAVIGWFAHVLWEEYRRPLDVPLTPFVGRTSRDLDESRYREASALDGTWRGVRWLPTENHHDERRS